MTNINKFKGKFITIEGIDGAGKSTQTQALTNYFISQGLNIVVTREPGGTKNAELIRNLILDNKFVPMAELLLFMAARCEHIETLIRPNLLEQKTVICDRFIDSTLVYQGLHGISPELINSLHLLTAQLIPDLTILIKTNISNIESRIAIRIQNNQYDQRQTEQFEQMQNRFIEIADNNSRFITIDGSGDSQQVHQNIIDTLIKYEFI